MIFNCIHDFSHTYGLHMGMLLMGIVGGFSHCILMCGAFVVAQSSAGTSSGTPARTPHWDLKKLAGLALLPYHIGRSVTYVAMAGLFYSVLNLAYLFLPLKNFVIVPMLLLAGVIFLASAFPVIARIFPWALHIRLNILPRYGANLLGKSLSSAAVPSQFLSGLLLGFIPCGMVVAAIMATSTAPTLAEAMLSMALFAGGTIPALVCVSWGTSYVKNKWSRHFVTIHHGALLISAVWIFSLAGFLVF